MKYKKEAKFYYMCHPRCIIILIWLRLLMLPFQGLKMMKKLSSTRKKKEKVKYDQKAKAPEG